MTESRLPPGGKNKFQEIKELIKKLIDEGVIKKDELIDMSIGQPLWPAFDRAKQVAAKTILSKDPKFDSYQDNGCAIGDFTRLFAESHMTRHLSAKDHTVPTPGTKPMIEKVIESCGSAYKHIKVGVMEGYPTPVDACKTLKVEYYMLPTTPENDFKFSPEDIEPNTDLLMLNYPHNPSGVIVDFAWWERICAYCEENDIRIFNDEAYILLAYSDECCSLADVAQNYPDLSWAVAWSASKVGNFTGWRVGLIIGSEYFVGDIKKCKGNTDSGFVAAMAAGVYAAFFNCKDEIEKCRQTYTARQKTLINILSIRGMKLAVKPGAGFFSLWLAPAEAFNKEIKNAEEFNNIMIEKTGIIGVPFNLQGIQYIRYSTTLDILALGMPERIATGFEKANISY